MISFPSAALRRARLASPRTDTDNGDLDDITDTHSQTFTFIYEDTKVWVWAFYTKQAHVVTVIVTLPQ